MAQFFEIDPIIDLLSCECCKSEFDTPRLLECGASICELCLHNLTSNTEYSNESYTCPVCKETHSLLNDIQFTINHKLLKLKKLEPRKVSRGKSIDELEKNFAQNQEKIYELDKLLTNNGADVLREFCIDLKSEIDLAVEKQIEKLRESSNRMTQQIEAFEQKSVKRLMETRIEIKNIQQLEHDFKSLQSDWSEKLRSHRIEEGETEIANQTLKKMVEKMEQEITLLKEIIFNKKEINSLRREVKNSECFRRINISDELEVEEFRGNYEFVIFKIRKMIQPFIYHKLVLSH